MVIDNMPALQERVRAGERDWAQYGNVRATYWNNLVLFNYTAKAMMDDEWPWLERVSRGLILNMDGEIVARPFDKFFNWDARHHTDAPLVGAAQKEDGSLGILYRHDGDLRIATRGSFDGPQAEWATTYLHEYKDVQQLAGMLDDSLTLLFEIVYPENRIVVDYDDVEALILIGARDRFTGRQFTLPEVDDLAALLAFPMAYYWPVTDLAELLADTEELDPLQQEGWVGHFADGSMYKFKSDAYRQMHKLATGATYRHTLEMMRAGELEGYLESLPPGLNDDVREWADNWSSELRFRKLRVEGAYAIAPKGSQKEFALWVNANCRDLAPAMFLRHRHKDYDDVIYKLMLREL